MRDDEHGNNDKSLRDKSETNIMVEFMDLLSQEGIGNNKLRKILAYVEQVLSEPPVLTGQARAILPYHERSNGFQI